jgi:hypothetical protein
MTVRIAWDDLKQMSITQQVEKKKQRNGGSDRRADADV